MVILLIIIFSFLLIILITGFINNDLKAICHGDPSARNIIDIILYPGLYAISMHRIIHILWRLKIPFIPRLLSQIVRFFTFIEIHPGAKLGKGIFIDHGDGVVIGETTIMGDNIIIYHQVTLGGSGKALGKRHPTIGSNVLIGAGTKILGNITIGDNCKIGAGSVLLKNVPKNSTAVGNPARIVSDKNEHYNELIESLELGCIPDPINDKFKKLETQIKSLRKTLKK